MTKQEFIAKVNASRKDNKNNWYTFTGTVENKSIRIKGFNTWLQVLEVDGLRFHTVMDISVKQFNDTLNGIFTVVEAQQVN